MPVQNQDGQPVYINKDFTVSQQADDTQKSELNKKQQAEEKARLDKINGLKDEKTRLALERKIKARDADIKRQVDAKKQDQAKQVNDEINKRVNDQRNPSPKPISPIFIKNKTANQIADDVRGQAKAAHQNQLSGVAEGVRSTWNSQIDRAIEKAQEQEKSRQREKPAEYSFEKPAHSPESSQPAFENARKDWRALRAEREAAQRDRGRER